MDPSSGPDHAEQLESSFLRGPYRLLMVRAREQVMFTLRVAVLLQAEVPRSEIGRRLGAKHVEVVRAVDRLAAVAEQIEREADF